MRVLAELGLSALGASSSEVKADDTQHDANHIHATWRDLTDDFGRDNSLEDYQRHAKDPGDH